MCLWLSWLWVIWNRGENQNSTRATCTRFCWWFREKFAFTALWDSSNQLTPARSFRLLPLLVICFETFALCLKNKYVYVHNCLDMQFPQCGASVRRASWGIDPRASKETLTLIWDLTSLFSFFPWAAWNKTSILDSWALYSTTWYVFFFTEHDPLI